MNKFTERLPHLTLLLAFKTVAEQGSFTRAANLLHLSQSAVSQQVVKLEEVLGGGLVCALHTHCHVDQGGGDTAERYSRAFRAIGWRV
ncbi:LysR family transcriptional regulator [Pseudomonas helleri]|uniref:LysR family transcriptional regulator n=1 Tax=Pseudomonas helleri TaxID=1608996 RepID=UPI003FD09A31